VCSQPCYPLGSACGDGFTCRAGDDEGFACLVSIDEGGCCSTGDRPGPALTLAALAAGWLGRRRRSRRAGAHGTPSMQQPFEQN
jgi:MYXO-CTERM domain-containing protein